MPLRIHAQCYAFKNALFPKEKSGVCDFIRNLFTEVKMPEISVLMPIYNTNEEYLRLAIESILNQTFPDFEFIILNDSPENTSLDDIINSYHDSRIHYFKNKENIGISTSHNVLLQKATGKYIALMDHDDISLPERLEIQVKYMNANPQVGICGTGFYRFGKTGKTKIICHPTDDSDIKSLLFFKCPILHPSCMMRTNVLKENHITYHPDFISVNDRQLFLDISNHAKLHNLPNVLYKYRYHENMTSRTRHKDIQKEQIEFRNTFCQMLDLNLTDYEKYIMNAYLLSGRCRIKDENILTQIESLLYKLITANRQVGFADTKAFNSICAAYLIKRCLNACIYGRISSYQLLKSTKIPVKNVEIPKTLSLFNFIKRRNL